MSIYLSIDIGGTFTKLGLFRVGEQAGQDAKPEIDCQSDFDYRSEFVCRPELVGRTEIPTRTEDEGVHIISDIFNAARKLIEENALTFADVCGVGFGVPGPVLPADDRGMPIDGCVNLNWSGIHYIDEEFRALSGIEQIRVINDANAAALGEYYFNPPVSGESESAVMITIGTGICGGIVSDGKIIAGAFGAAGEIGHMPMSPAHPLLEKLCAINPSLQRSADLEYFASASGIVRMAKAALNEEAADGDLLDDRSSLWDCEQLDARAVINAAKNGAATAVLVMDFFFDTLGRGLAAVASVIDPEVFIIGGGVSAAGEYLLDGLCTSYRKYAFHASRNAAFRLATLENDAGLYGALVPLL